MFVKAHTVPRVAALAGALVLFPAGYAIAQTQVWSEPTRTEIWSETGNGKTQGHKSAAQPAKPKPATKGKVDPRLVGTWDVRIPTAVTYHTRGQSTYQRITPGSNFNRLTIHSSGAYQWGPQKGTLKEVRPYFIAEGQRYFEVKKDAKNKYLIRYNERDKSLAMFFDVGGFVAKGTRVSTAKAKPKARPSAKKKRR